MRNYIGAIIKTQKLISRRLADPESRVRQPSAAWRRRGLCQVPGARGAFDRWRHSLFANWPAKTNVVMSILTMGKAPSAIG